MTQVVSTKIYELLSNIVNGSIDNYSLTVHEPNKKGEGYLGDMCFVSMKDKIDKKNGKQFDFIVKQAFTDEKLRNEFGIRICFLNEIYFYTRVWPELQKFHNEKSLMKPFNKIPRCFATTTENTYEKLVLENLKLQNFQMHDKKKPLDKKHFELIFKQYGRFHAISSAYKLLHPQEFSELMKGLTSSFSDLCDRKPFADFLKSIFELSFKSLNPKEDAKAIEKFKQYIENGLEIVREAAIYKGDHSLIVHGDCWSNNMMFKYNKSKEPIDMRFLDFQFSNSGTPVSDLSYCFYSGGSKETFDNLDYYLRVYHDSLSETLEEFGCEPETVYPFEQLKKDWVPYCRMGFLMGLMLWRGKLTDDEDVIDFKDIKESGEEGKTFINSRYDEESYKKISRDLILHMYENGFL